MTRNILVIVLLTLFGCNTIPLPSDTSVNDETNQCSDYWFTNSKDLDSSTINLLTNHDWLLFQTTILPDSVQVIDLSNTKGFYFTSDTSTTNRTVLRFHSDFTITELTTHINGKWSIIHNKNINIQWDKPVKEDISGQYSIAYFKNQRLHLFRGSYKQKARTTHLFRQIN